MLLLAGARFVMWFAAEGEVGVVAVVGLEVG